MLVAFLLSVNSLSTSTTVSNTLWKKTIAENLPGFGFLFVFFGTFYTYVKSQVVHGMFFGIMCILPICLYIYDENYIFSDVGNPRIQTLQT